MLSVLAVQEGILAGELVVATEARITGEIDVWAKPSYTDVVVAVVGSAMPSLIVEGAHIYSEYGPLQVPRRAVE